MACSGRRALDLLIKKVEEEERKEIKKAEEEEREEMRSQIKRPVECPVCKLRFRDSRDFAAHATGVHKNRNVYLLIEQAEEKERQEIKKAIEKEREEIKKAKEKEMASVDVEENEDGEGGSSRFKCSDCEECFSTIQQLVQHSFSHMQDEPHVYFGQVFGNADSDSDSDSDSDADSDSDEEEEGNEVWLTHKSLARTCRSRADSALDFFNKVNPAGKRYGFVEQGPNMSSNRVIEHINFKAREKGRKNAPVETFFAQFRFAPGRRVECCVSLGPTASLPHWRKANLGGCKLCNGLIHHPTTPVDNLVLE